jgi:hypothetical protein
MPHTKSKGQTRGRGTKTERRTTTRKVRTGRQARSHARNRLRELPTRSGAAIKPSQRAQAERSYAGDTTRRFDIARGKRFAMANEAGSERGPRFQPGSAKGVRRRKIPAAKRRQR